MMIEEAIKCSIAFIEDNLHQDIGVLDVATSVSFSQFYFSREFSRHVHSSIYDYIIRRKLSEAYKALFNSRPKIVDLAFQYGFQSHEGFSRAFRKMFGENPSEVSIYKPYLIYERVDEPYLNFLRELKLRITAEDQGEAYFIIDSAAENMNAEQLLVLLNKEHLLGCSCLLRGIISDIEQDTVGIKLSHMHHKVRFFSTDIKNCYRYFLNNLYDASEMRGNYILISRSFDAIDLYVPTQKDLPHP